MTMHWDKLLTTERYGHGFISGQELGRSHYHKDQDRIVFSAAFRKLTGKTQVHPLAINDQIHTRLIHSIEVGSVGRTLGIKVGERIARELPDWIEADDLGVIVQSACFAHDIGNPPFGHAGEYAIQDWFKQSRNAWLTEPLSEPERADLKNFEGNAQGFRIVSQLEYHLFHGGLRLTYPTLGTLLKYPWTIENVDTKGKFSCFQSERLILDELASKLGLIKGNRGQYSRHPLSYLMEAADDICYAIIDLEDAVELHILDYEEVKPILLTLCGERQMEIPELHDDVAPHRKLAALRGRAMQAIIDSIVGAFETHLPAIMCGEFSGDLLAAASEHVVEGMLQAKSLARNKVFLDSAKTETELGAYHIISTLLDVFIPAGFELFEKKDNHGLSYRTKRVFDLMGGDAPMPRWSLYEIYQRQLDFVTGMTDNYSGYLARQIGGTGPGLV
ncbi:deoxyguanosinetriphosphate triphosphohydrolase [Gynuella sp.]|uniref:deoxyguanosinetriphosphate triphosphohydrolase n=1 Tax=Gynuella sp. TaxID=2969146 RepID=UPI003D0BA0DE